LGAGVKVIMGLGTETMGLGTETMTGLGFRNHDWERE